MRGLRSLKDLTLEDVLLTVAIYGVFALYAAAVIPFWSMQLLVILYVIRVFNLRHEKAHLPARKSWLHALEVFHTPYQEPFAEKRRKHLAHHRAHLNAQDHVDFTKNPHERLEHGLLRSLFTAAFYHEVMLYVDLRRDHGLSRERTIGLLRTTAMIALTCYVAGTANFMAFFLAYRVASFLAWFSFSYLLHIRSFYENDLGARLPYGLKWAFERVFGRGSVTAIFHHQFHHRRPNHFYLYGGGK